MSSAYRTGRPGAFESDLDRCLAVLQSYPDRVADDVGRCTLRATTTGVPDVACWTAATHEHFAAMHHTQQLVGRVRQIVRERMQTRLAIPQDAGRPGPRRADP